MRVARTGWCSSRRRWKMRMSVSTLLAWPKITSGKPQRRWRSRSRATSPISAVGAAARAATKSAWETRPESRSAVRRSMVARCIPPSYCGLVREAMVQHNREFAVMQTRGSRVLSTKHSHPFVEQHKGRSQQRFTYNHLMADKNVCPTIMTSCVLAYSGGLDTSVILGWLQEQGYEIHAVYVDLGQPCEDRQAILKKAQDCGAKSARIVDAQEELCRDFAFPVLQWQAKYEGIYLLGTSIARPLISKVCLQVAREVGADAYAHGATGKGNDQCRFQLAAEALNPAVKVIAPWRMEKFRQRFPGRTEMIAFCNEKKIPVKASVSKPY